MSDDAAEGGSRIPDRARPDDSAGGPSEESAGVEEPGTQVVTLPNLLSFVRLALVPVFLTLLLTEQDIAALLVLVFSSITDYLDGWLARRLHQVTRLGQLLDPAADRLYIIATVIGLAVREVVPWWLVAVIIGRDVLLIVLGIVLAAHRYGPLPVHHLGKVATFCLFYALPLIVLGQAFPVLQAVAEPLGWAFALWGAFLYWWAGIVYAIQTVRLVTGRASAEPAESGGRAGDKAGESRPVSDNVDG